MLNIKKIENLFWRNVYCKQPVLVVSYDNVFDWSFSNTKPEISQILTKKFPILASLNDISALEFISKICSDLHHQKFIAPAESGITVNQIWFTATDIPYATATALTCTSLVNLLIQNPDISEQNLLIALDKFDDNCEPNTLDQSTRAIANAATAREIPWFRLFNNSVDIQLGQGFKQQRMRETISSKEDMIAHTYSRSKDITNKMLANANIPCGVFDSARTPQEAAEKAAKIGFPVVIKPVFGGKGIDVVMGISSREHAFKVAQNLFTRHSELQIQSHIKGDDYRLLIIGGKMVAAALREPAYVIGDGKNNIKQLIDIANLDPRRGKKFYKIMNYIEVDDEVIRILAEQGFSLDSVPPNGAKVKLRLTANIATGGTATDVTDVIHPDNVAIAERATRVIGLKACGVDLITTDITKSWKETAGAICEVNSSPGMRPHWLSNPNRDVVNPVLNTVFAPNDNGRIPTALITGSNGKTTTTRMLDHILRAAGHFSGAVTTDGITINGDYILEGDVAGVFGASKILNDPTITAAVMETARGGILKNGIYLDFCDVAALLNVDFEQVGIDGIETVEAMANLKRKVVETARKKIVLNAENHHCLNIAKDFHADFVILFAVNDSLDTIINHVNSGGVAVVLKNNIITICDKKNNIEVIDINNVSACFEGKVEHNIANALAACALAYGMDIDIKTIAKGLQNFTPDSKNSSGRFAFVENFFIKTIFDFAHNPPALKMAVKAINKFKTNGKSICLFNSPGNRPDFQIEDCAKAVAGNFDFYIPFERDYWRRNRKSGEISEMLMQQLLKSGVKKENIIPALNEKDAISAALNIAKSDDFIIIFGSDAKACEDILRKELSSFNKF